MDLFFVFSSNTSWADVESMPIRVYRNRNDADSSLRDKSEYVLSMVEATSLASESKAVADEMSALMMGLYKTQFL